MEKELKENEVKEGKDNKENKINNLKLQQLSEKNELFGEVYQLLQMECNDINSSESEMGLKRDISILNSQKEKKIKELTEKNKNHNKFKEVYTQISAFRGKINMGNNSQKQKLKYVKTFTTAKNEIPKVKINGFAFENKKGIFNSKAQRDKYYNKIEHYINEWKSLESIKKRNQSLKNVIKPRLLTIIPVDNDMKNTKGNKKQRLNSVIHKKIYMNELCILEKMLKGTNGDNKEKKTQFIFDHLFTISKNRSFQKKKNSLMVDFSKGWD